MDYRKQLLSDGAFPIQTQEGITKCYDYLLSLVINGKFQKTSVSRTLRLDGYKSPNWSEKDTTEIRLNTSVNIAEYLLESTRVVYREGGAQAVEEEFPAINASGTQWTQIMTISRPTLEALIKNPHGGLIGSSLEAIINCCNVYGEHSCTDVDCPYKIRHTNDVPESKEKIGRSDGRYRFYLNCPSGRSRGAFLESYAKKCIDRRIPFDMKDLELENDGKSPEPQRSDGVILYILPDHLEDSLAIMKEIEEENPELIKQFGTPPMTTAQMSYFGVSQSRKDATWNHMFDRVSKFAFVRTMLAYMSASGEFTSEEKEALTKQVNEIDEIDFYSTAIKYPSFSPDMEEFIKSRASSLNKASLRDMFSICLKQLFSKANFGDKKHTNYPFCFGSAFYSAKER